MDPELLRALRSCTAAVDDLLEQIEQDVDDMSVCIHGEILAEYQKGMCEAERLARSMKQHLHTLQAELE